MGGCSCAFIADGVHPKPSIGCVLGGWGWGREWQTLRKRATSSGMAEIAADCPFNFYLGQSRNRFSDVVLGWLKWILGVELLLGRAKPVSFTLSAQS